MNDDPIFNFTEALLELEQYDICDQDVYLIDLIPLIEIIWADGMTQSGELEILDQYLVQHVAHVNKLADCEILELSYARSFVKRFLNRRPDPKLLETLRGFIKRVRMNTTSEEVNEAVKESILSACLNIAASSTREYPYGLTDRFELTERNCFFEILRDLEK